MKRASVVAIALTLVSGCGTGDATERAAPQVDSVGAPAVHPEAVHIHGLALAAGDVLLIATHNGLFELESGADEPAVVGETRHDLMGFTALGPDHFLASGHPDVRGMREDDLPPHLGLIESRDRGETWQSVSLLGDADFHVLRAAGERVYGFDSTHGRLLASSDGGRSWDERPYQGHLFDLALDPDDPDRLVASGEQGLQRSADGGRSWEAAGDAVGLLAWPEAGPLYLVEPGGAVSAWTSGGSWQHAGDAGGEPVAFLAVGPRELYLAIHGGRIVHSADGGESWTIRLDDHR